MFQFFCGQLILIIVAPHAPHANSLSYISLSDVTHQYKQINMERFGLYFFLVFASSQKDKFYLFFLTDT